MATDFEPHECVIFVQSTKIGTHENKAIRSILLVSFTSDFRCRLRHAQYLNGKLKQNPH